MGEVVFCQTDDGSIGLYNSKVGDIYHSTFGAYTEAYEKFICASGFNEYIKSHDTVSVLDICYGIGYNTKTAINEILNLEKDIELHIDALEYDKKLIAISPLIKKQKIDNAINEFLIEKSNLPKEFSFWKTIKYFYKTKGLSLINWQNLWRLIAHYKKNGVYLYPLADFLTFYHNIYYNYISHSMKNRSKTAKLAKTSVTFHSDDARAAVLKLDRKYNFIFLDAFTPKKLPTLWSYEFFKELYRLLDDTGVLVTYSSSAPVRSAMLEAGFFVGRSEDKNGKIIGTVATKNESLIKYKLQEFDKELLKTKAGIFYRDENLNATEAILTARRNQEVENSNRISSSRLKRIWKEKSTT